MLRYVLILLTGLLLSLFAMGQTVYDVGYGQASIEPEEDFLSVALQGYGHPPQGRFSLVWKSMETAEVSEPLSFTGSEDGLFALALSGDLFCRNDSSQWGDMGATNPVVLLAGSSPDSYKVLAAEGNLMYGVSLLNELYIYDMSVSPMSWKKIAKVPDAVAMAVSGGKCYVISADGMLHEGILSAGGKEFRSISEVPGRAFSMASFRDRLYVLLDNQTIWEYDLSGKLPWRMVAYLNGVTYKEPLKFIAVSRGILYGMGFDNRIFKASSLTEGNISVRTLAVSDGKTTVMITGMDLGAVDYEFTVQMKNEVAAATGVNPENQLVNVSHSHFTPVSKNWFAFGDSGIPDERYLEKVKKAYVMSAMDAVAQMRKSRLSFARANVPVGYNRGLAGADSMVEPTLDMVLCESLSGPERHLIFENACHPVFPNSGKERFTVSANWPGIAREKIEDAVPGLKTLFLQGCAGDINPLSNDYRKTGCEVADAVIAALEGQKEIVRGRIRVKADSVHIPVAIMSKEQVMEFKKANENRTGDIEAEKNVRWADHMLHLYQAGSVPRTMPVYFHIVDIGDWRLVALSREPVTEYALRIRSLWPKKNVTVVGYTEDVCSYLTSDVHLKTGNYESRDSFFWYGEPSFFPEGTLDMIVTQIKKSVK